jgi:hypothetical protein
MRLQFGIVVCALATIALSFPVVRSTMAGAVPSVEEQNCRNIVCPTDSSSGTRHGDAPDLRWRPRI